MTRITCKMLRKWIDDWNESHRGMEMHVSIYNGYYHISRGKTGSNIIVESTPGKTWEAFCIWKNGYYAGLESAGDDRR